MELSECVIDGFSGSIHITAFLMSDLSDRLILHQHANPPLLNRGQLNDRFIQLCDLLIPYQGIFQRVPFIRFRHFQNILDRGPIAVINFFAVNTLGLILQGASLVIQFITDGDLLVNSIIILHFDRFHSLPPNRFVCGCGRTI